MASSDLRPGPTRSQRSIRRTWAVPLSLALHAGAFYAIALVPWAASETPQLPVPQHPVVWLKDWPRPSTAERALDPTDERARADESTPPEVPPEQQTANVAPPRPARASPERTPATAPTEPRPAAASPPPPAVDREAAPASTLPEVDWEKERHSAVHDVLEQRARQRDYLTFSLDDLVKEPEPADDDVLPPLVNDHCLIVKGKLERFAALITGRCVREARSDLFAALKPAYLKAHPVCIETRPDRPGSFLSDGRQISTVKCQLVANDEQQ